MKKLNEAPSTPAPLSRRAAKVAKTRGLILSAARKVFTRHSFASASIRLIEEEGGFNHSAIYYHFKTKSELFEAVVRELYAEYLADSIDLINEGGRAALRDDLSRTIDRMLDFGFQKPAILKIMMLNIGETDHIKEMAGGFHYFQKYSETIYGLFIKNHSFCATKRTITMWISAFHILCTNYLGSPELYKQALYMGVEDEKYRRFIKHTLMLIFYPSLKGLVVKDLYPPNRISGEKMKKKTSPEDKAKQLAAKGPVPAAKGDISRARILEVARAVFARSPYNSASIRMIGEAGDFDFTLLYHYFPTKADLFEAVIENIFADLSFFVEHITIEMNEGAIRESLSLLIDSVVNYFWTRSESFMVCMQNIAQIDSLQDFPGTHHLLKIIMNTQDQYRLTNEAANEEIQGLIYGMGTILINLIGAPTLYGRIIGMDPKSPGYKRWIKDLLMFVFYPSLKEHLLRWPDLYGKPFASLETT